MMEKSDIEKLVENGWLNGFNKKELQKLQNFINKLKFDNVSPEKDQIFNAFKIGGPEEVKVLILGQDPYPSNGKNKGRAHGYAFSFGDGKKPAEDSLLNIFEAVKKYKDENGTKSKGVKEWNTNLENWAKTSKVLLLNTALTYEKGKKTEHQNIWKNFIEYVIEKLCTAGKEKLVVFLWGDDAKVLFHKVIFDKKVKITRDLLVLSTSHPSEKAYKKGFCYEAPNHFKACDEFLGQKIWLDFK